MYLPTPARSKHSYPHAAHRRPRPPICAKPFATYARLHGPIACCKHESNQFEYTDLMHGASNMGGCGMHAHAHIRPIASGNTGRLGVGPGLGFRGSYRTKNHDDPGLTEPKNHNNPGLWNQKPRRPEITEPKNQGSSSWATEPRTTDKFGVVWPEIVGVWSKNWRFRGAGSGSTGTKLKEPKTSSSAPFYLTTNLFDLRAHSLHLNIYRYSGAGARATPSPRAGEQPNGC